MKNINLLCFVLLVLILTSACSDPGDLPPVPKGVQTFSLLGDTLYNPELAPEILEVYHLNLLEAVSNYREDPEDADNIIWLGRRSAYLGEYREAVRVFTEGVYKHADDPRMFRHRGHRYITLRMFDSAIEDFNTAVGLMNNMRDQIEPDGLPNELNQPVSTLKSNVWYHLGLAHYLKGEYAKAIEAYENAFDLDLTDDMYIATLYWYYSALKRSGRDEEAGMAVSGITPDIQLIENDTYLNLILVFNGIFDAKRIAETEADALANTTMLYGLGNWHYMNGRTDRAFEIWQEIYDSGNWAAFGFIAAEAELAGI